MYLIIIIVCCGGVCRVVKKLYLYEAFVASLPADRKSMKDQMKSAIQVCIAMAFFSFNPFSFLTRHLCPSGTPFLSRVGHSLHQM